MRQSKRLLSLSAVVLIAACTDNSITNPMTDAAGTYQLTVYAGRSIPATYTIQPGDPSYPQYPNGATFVVTNGTLVLNENGTFTETNNYQITPPGGSPAPSSFVSNGTWSLNGTTFNMFAQAQNGNGPRNITGTLDTDINGLLTVNYQEDNGAGLESYEYKR